MHRLPMSPSLSQALVEFEPILLDKFRSVSAKLNGNLQDVMHYALFSVAERFAACTAWVVAPRLEIPTEKIATAVCAIETLRCSLAYKQRLHGPSGLRESGGERFVEPVLAEAAAYGLVPVAFDLLYSDARLSDSERVSLGTILARTASPARMLSALHEEIHLGGSASYSAPVPVADLRRIHEEKVAPIYEAAGQTLELYSKRTIEPGALSHWFRKLGLFANWMALWKDLDGHRTSNQHLNPFLSSASDAMDTIMGIEAELLETARELGIQRTAHELIEPMASLLKSRLQ